MTEYQASNYIKTKSVSWVLFFFVIRSNCWVESMILVHAPGCPGPSGLEQLLSIICFRILLSIDITHINIRASHNFVCDESKMALLIGSWSASLCSTKVLSGRAIPCWIFTQEENDRIITMNAKDWSFPAAMIDRELDRAKELIRRYILMLEGLYDFVNLLWIEYHGAFLFIVYVVRMHCSLIM